MSSYSLLCFLHCSVCGPMLYLWHTIETLLWKGNLNLLTGFLTAVTTAVSGSFTRLMMTLSSQQAWEMKQWQQLREAEAKEKRSKVFCQLVEFSSRSVTLILQWQHCTGTGWEQFLQTEFLCLCPCQSLSLAAPFHCLSFPVLLGLIYCELLHDSLRWGSVLAQVS